MREYCESCPFKGVAITPGQEGEYYCGERCIETEFTVDPEALSRISSPPEGERIPDPLTPEDRIRLQTELKGVTRAQDIGKLAAMGLRNRAAWLRRQPL